MRFLVLVATLRSLSQQYYYFRGGVHHVPTMSAATAWSPSSSVPRRRALASSSSSSSAAAAAAGPPVTWCPERRVYVGGVVPALSVDEVESLLRESEDGSLSVFGYGSLCWRPGEGTVLSAPGVTTSRRRVVGLRRCWAQRSADHRGTPEFPGLVCTLVTDDEYEAILREEGCDHEQKYEATTTSSTTTEGVSYAVPSHLVNDCLAELDFREKGGYARDVVDTVSNDDATDPRFTSTRALLYRGTADNPAFSRRALLDEHYAAATISAATGPSGPNDEYLYELDAFLANDDADDDDAEDGDAVTRRLAELCRGFRRSGTTFFFLSGCGSTDHGRLSSTLPDHLRTGGNVERLTELAVAVRDRIGEPRALYAGGGHCGVTTTDGRLWLWGWNENGQLGRHDDVDDDNENETPVRPLMVEDDEPLLVDEVSLGHAHTLVIERGTGRLYAFGDDARGQVGGGDNDNDNDESGRSSVVVRPVVPDIVKHDVVVHAAAGVFVSAAVTSEGDLVTWGDRSRSSNAKKQTSFSLRWRPDDGGRLVKVACGKRHVVALDDRGRVWTVAAGRNDRYGVSGKDPTSDDQDLVPRLVEDLPGVVVDVDCGWSHCVAQVRESNDDGVTTTSLYGWGRNDHGQLGVDSSLSSSSSKSSSSVVRRPRRLTDDVVVAISCGAESTVARTASGVLVSCGWNEHGNAGTGGFEDARTWTRIDDDGARLPPGDRVVFAAGGGHMLVMGTRDVGTSKQA